MRAADWRYVGLKVGIRLAIWTLIVALAVGILALNGMIGPGTVSGILPLTAMVAAGLAEVVFVRFGIVSRSGPPSDPNAERPKG